MADKKPLKFWEDTTGSPWVLYFSWNNEENMPSFRMVSNTPPVGSSEGEEDFTYAIRVSENTKNQIDKFELRKYFCQSSRHTQKRQPLRPPLIFYSITYKFCPSATAKSPLPLPLTTGVKVAPE